jgi:transposase
MKDEILKLHADGKSYRQIQAILGCSKGTIAYHLGVGQKDKTRQRARDKRGQITKLLQEVKQNTPCYDCKENYPYWIMEFDHLGDKSFTIAHYRSHTSDLEKVKKEIAKCDVVCSNCHKNRTYLRSAIANSNTMDVESFYENMLE